MTDQREPIEVIVRLDGNAVVSPVLSAVKLSVEAVAIFLRALEKTDYAALPDIPDAFAQFRLEDTTLTQEKHRQAHINWVLGKGFHELARAVRQSLEEAHLFVEIAKLPGGISKYEELLAIIDDIRKRGQAASFPDLMQRVNAGLSSPMTFSDEFKSLQKVRNCMEHRNGIVSEKDADATGLLRLTLPSLDFFLKEGDTLTPITSRTRVEKGTVISYKRCTMERQFSRGDRVSFTSDDFAKIGQACYLFAIDLGAKLPVIPVVPTEGFTQVPAPIR